MRQTTWRLAAAGLVIVALALPSAASAVDVRATTTTFRSLAVETTMWAEGADAVQVRNLADADESGAVSVEEMSVLTSAIDDLIGNPNATSLDAYTITWARENASGAKGFTLLGRANLSNAALGWAGSLRSSASWDGINGTLDRIQTSFTGLALPVAANVTIELLMQVTYAFPALDRNENVHRLTLALPPGSWVHLSVGGSLEVVRADNLDAPMLDASNAAVWGNATAPQATFLVKERAVSNEARWIVIAAVLVPAGLVAVVAVYALPRMRVEDTPLLVEPKYK